jgi:Bacterial mobilisation protein (MobC)
VENEIKKPLSHRGRSGTENRQKQRRITVRLSPEEYARLEASAGTAGLTIGSHVRATMLNAPKTRMRRRPLADVAALAKLSVELNRIGGNINQITKRVNFGETPVAAEFSRALSGLDEILSAIRQAMGLDAK